MSCGCSSPEIGPVLPAVHTRLILTNQQQASTADVFLVNLHSALNLVHVSRIVAWSTCR